MLLTLPEIAAWQIDHPSAQPDPRCIAELPALQRGAVWKVGQIEALWDSIFQGFPLGAFLLSPFDASLGQQSFKHQTRSACALRPTHMLLDGQQRATGIALGFLSPWRSMPLAADVKSVLWIDLAPPPNGRDVAYVFRTVTRAHPWGYSLVDPERRITQHQIRQSLHAFRAASFPLYDAAKPHDIPLHAVWPWDAVSPVPVSLLVQALHETQGAVAQAKGRAWQAIQQLAFMRTMADGKKAPISDHTKHWSAQQDTVRRAFNDPDSRLDDMLALLWQRMSEYAIPANVVPLCALKKITHTTADSGQQSPVETLFIRVNSAGTPLGGEELMYSLIKSSWIDAPKAITQLTHKLATPARIALLASRLVRARHQRAQQTARPGEKPSKLRLIVASSIDDFRRLMDGQNKEHPKFAEDLKNYVSRDGLQVFEAAHRFLTKDQHGLPPILASELAQKSPDVFFLFLCWLDRLMFDGAGVQLGAVDSTISMPAARRVLGFLTALAWFAKADSKPRAVDAIWHDLQTLDVDKLPDFFNRQRFLKTMAIDTHGKQNMIPVLNPDVLELALQKCILGYQGCTETISRSDSIIWKDWNWWHWLIDQKRPKDINDALHPIFQEANLAEGETVPDRIRDTWNQFMDALRGNKSMLLYVQRDWIKRWFSDFDPSLPEFLEDKNRPWDYDHIYAQSFLQGRNGGTLQGLPRIIKDWHNSIGNLRAWPLEANRSDGDVAPSIKLKTTSAEEAKYGITDANKCAASFITPDDFDRYWSRCNPAHGKKLNDANNTFPARQALINAIVWRFLAIYRQWYDDLKLSTLT